MRHAHARGDPLQRIATPDDVEIAERRARRGGVRGRRRSAFGRGDGRSRCRARQRARQLFRQLQMAARTQAGVRRHAIHFREPRSRHAVSLRDGGHGLALAHAMRARRDLPGIQLVGGQPRRSAFPRSMFPRCRRAAAAGSHAARAACRCKSSGATRDSARATARDPRSSARSSVASRTNAGMVISRNFCSGRRSSAPKYFSGFSSMVSAARNDGKKLREAKPKVRLL